MTFSDEIEKLDTVRAYHVCFFSLLCMTCEPAFNYFYNAERTGARVYNFFLKNLDLDFAFLYRIIL